MSQVHPDSNSPLFFLFLPGVVQHLQKSATTRSHARHGRGVLAAKLFALLADARDVRAANGVPGRDVLFHAGREAAFLLGGERVAGGRDAAVEAVFVEFLFWRV